MAISSRGEMGVGGGSRGGFGGGGRSVKPSLKKKLAEPKSAVKVIPANKNAGNRNMTTTWNVLDAKSGITARQGAASVNIGRPKATVKINSGRANRTRSGNKAK